MNDSLARLIQYRLDRARESHAEALLMASSDHWNTCVNRLYYACFYAVNALLLAKGMETGKHTGVRSLLNRHFVKTGLIHKDLAVLFNRLFDFRQNSDYMDLYRPDPHTVKAWIPQCKEFIEAIETLISDQGREAKV